METVCRLCGEVKIISVSVNILEDESLKLEIYNLLHIEVRILWAHGSTLLSVFGLDNIFILFLSHLDTPERYFADQSLYVLCYCCSSNLCLHK